MKNTQLAMRSRKNMIVKAIIAATIALGASTAQAATNNWAGGYAGIDLGVGFDLGDSGQLKYRRVDGSDNSAAINSAFGSNFDGEFEAGGTAGVRAGYNFQDNNLVYGVIGDISYADITEEQRAFSNTPRTYIERRELNTLVTLRGKLGYASDLPILPFITGGIAYGNTKYSWQGNSGAFRGDNGEDGNGIGYVVGMGVDFMLNEQMTMGLEFLHYNLGDSGYQARFSGPAAFGSAASGGSIQEGTKEDFAFQTLKVSLNWKF